MKSCITAGSKAEWRGFKQQVLSRTEVQVVDPILNLNRALCEGEYFSVIANKEDFNRKRVHQMLYSEFNLVMDGAKFYLFWLKQNRRSKKFIRAVRKQWVTNLKTALKKIIAFDKENFVDKWDDHYNDFTNQIKMGGDNQDQAKRVYDYMSGRYDWVDWVLIIYDEVSWIGEDGKRYVKVNDAKRIKFEEDWDDNKDRNVILAWMDVESNMIDASKAWTRLGAAKLTKKKTFHYTAGEQVSSQTIDVPLEDAEETGESINADGFGGLLVLGEGYNLAVEGEKGRYIRAKGSKTDMIILQ